MDSREAMFIHFEATCSATLLGDRVGVVGSTDGLGNWDPSRALVLATHAQRFPLWCGQTAVVGGGGNCLSWKLVIIRKTGDVVWEKGQDRILQLESQGLDETHIVQCRFGHVEEICRLSSLSLLRSCEGDETPGSDASSEASTMVPFLSPTNGHDMLDDSSCMSQCEDTVPLLWAAGHTIGKDFGDCEDAFWVGDRGLAVADGVGSMVQFARHGVNAAAYAAELVQLAGNALQGCNDQRPVDLASAAMLSAEQDTTTFGASTLCAVSLSSNIEELFIGAANLGDSGFMVLRDVEGSLEIVAKSREKQHRWNTPFQFMRIPDSLREKAVRKNGKRAVQDDAAADADLYEIPVMIGDLVLLFTDGFTDNVYDCDVPGLIRTFGYVEPDQIARALAEYAHKASLDPSTDVPFSEAALKAGREHPGGKPDDITVVAAWVTAS
eukprot:TRINITY_DN61732_c0_g1_i1.p1 TRINITY_DN61732_c0_g1~~TRINITY_DN61732_c0_g1_i1.p1  ORF type:complete len:438 (-),score=67.08 TRINITY_DN61732_c0_g1_i1:42-1355(-)